MKLKCLAAGALCVVQSVWVASAVAEIYHYTDDRGRKVYVDRQSQIPPRFREQTQARKEESETLSRAERERRQQTLSRLAAQKGTQGRLAAIEREMASLEQRADVRGNSVKIPVTLRHLGNTQTVNLIVDTGASRTVVHQSAISRLGGLSKPGGYAQVVGGARIPTRLLPVDGISFGPVDQGKSEVMVIEPSTNPGYDGLLGMDILGRLKYEIDMQRKVVIWHADRYRELAQAKKELLAEASSRPSS
ncbi:retropepsin-like aspartic protease [Marinobacterium weihaiense]|uniref:Retroviral-like aspartic protease family protein n=1 Tax=Marinobacterium weihaiense TaxID=2851016 RepID=A0ABS6M9L9_9GAMM|nr:retropepsin-like aspartic protease [Marinobacterium weihaiense]MBV0932983.1 retroviral-like aspartic protease family protein [Marinobacterium weihaiense]